MVQIRKQSRGRSRSPRQAARQVGAVDRQLDPTFFSVLSDPTRVKLLACVAKCGGPRSVGEIAECCSVDLSGVSRHLALLARAGWLEIEKKGRTVFYRARYAELCSRLRSLADAIEQCCPGGGDCGSSCKCA
jgi:ArsR family transcriptional regulator, arsenate/arsenite/antimonite-responsive transcriptional repressor